jgi:hypothetical protein
MANVPLNLFRRKSITLTTNPVKVYEAPIERAGIIITALATNLTNVPQTITAGLSTGSYTTNDDNGNPLQVQSTYFDIIKDFELAPNDAANIVVNKMVMFQGDIFVSSCGSNYYPTGSTNPTVNLTLSLLEAVNIP